jgi:hypothetical protein
MGVKLFLSSCLGVYKIIILCTKKMYGMLYIFDKIEKELMMVMVKENLKGDV